MTQGVSHRQILNYTKTPWFLSLSTCQGEGTLAILEEIVSISVNKTECSLRALRGALQIMWIIFLLFPWTEGFPKWTRLSAHYTCSWSVSSAHQNSVLMKSPCQASLYQGSGSCTQASSQRRAREKNEPTPPAFCIPILSSFMLFFSEQGHQITPEPCSCKNKLKYVIKTPEHYLCI